MSVVVDAFTTGLGVLVVLLLIALLGLIAAAVGGRS